MYRAFRLYPGGFDGLRECLYVSRSVHNRLSAMLKELTAWTKEHKCIPSFIDYDDPEIYRLMNYNIAPYLDIYLKAAKLLNWDISRDVNYAYAEVIYPPEDIERRVRRLYPITRDIYAMSFLLVDQIGYDIETVLHTIRYKKKRSSCCYGRMMHYIMKAEREKQYADALDFEE